jgi:nucleotide-binding universal stress UspA family protein
MKLLIPLDGSPSSEAALRFAPLLKPLGIDRVVLMSVCEDFDHGAEARGADDFYERESVLYTAYLRDAARRLEGAMTCEVRSELRCGRPADEIRKLARAEQVDLIMMSTHGRSGLSRWAIGSVADKVLRSSEHPMFVIGPKAARKGAPGAIARVAVPLDGSTPAEAALKTAREWALGLDARLYLVRAVDLPTFPSEEALIYSPELVEAARRAAAQYLDEVAAGIDGVKVETAVLVGQPAVQLTSFCRNRKIDLVVMTTHGRGAVARAILGSTTDRLLHGPAPVLVIPSR